MAVLAALMAPRLAMAEQQGCSDPEGCPSSTQSMFAESDVSCGPRELEEAKGWAENHEWVRGEAKTAANLTACAVGGGDQKKPKCTDGEWAARVFWSRLMGRYVRSLQCALQGTADDEERGRIVEELLRVFSGAIAADAGDIGALRTLLEKADSERVQSLSEAVELYSRLRDPNTRAAFLGQLDRLGQSNGALAGALHDVDAKSEGGASLLNTLLNAERSSLAMGMAFLQDIDVQSRRATRAVYGLQLIVQKNWDASSGRDRAAQWEGASSDFVQALKQLLTLLTAEGIQKEQVVRPRDEEGSLRRTLCRCAKDAKCRGALLVDLTASGNTIVPRASLYFRKNLESLCQSQATSSVAGLKTEYESVTSSESIPVDCAPPATPVQCVNERAAVASLLMNELSLQFSMFGNVGFLTVDRKVEGMAAARHQGVTVNELWDETTKRVPRLLDRGLSTKNGGCDPALHQAVDQVLSSRGYADEIGKLAGGSAPTLVLTPEKPGSCKLELHDAKGQRAYSARVTYAHPATPKEAGEDLGHTVGQIYVALRRAQLLARNSELENRESARTSESSPYTSLLVAGAPFLLDQDPRNDTWGWVYGAADTLGLIVSVVMLPLAVGARNDAEEHVSGAHSRSQVFLGATYGGLTLSAVARGASLVHALVD